MTTGEQPLTRRQAREAERSRDVAPPSTPQQSRRAVVPEPTTGGAAPHLAMGFLSSADALASAAEAEARSTRPAVATAAPAVTPPTPTTAPPASFSPPAGGFRPHSFQPTDAPAAPSGVSPMEPVPQRTLTRRELRASLASQDTAEPRTDVVAVIRPAADAPAEPTVAEGSRRATWTPPAEDESGQRPVWAATPAPADTESPAPVVAAASPMPVFSSPVSASGSASPASAPLAVPPPAAAIPAQPLSVDDTGSHKPVGHWSVESDHDTDPQGMAPQAFDQLLSRGISSGGVPTTTNALILPAIPSAGDGPSARNTGEVLVTGSFDLPSSFGSTGAHPDRIDSSDIDRMFEAEDDAPATGAQPIRASRAVSSHTATREVIKPPTKEKRWSAPFLLSLAAVVLGVGVIGLVIAGFVSGIF